MTVATAVSMAMVATFLLWVATYVMILRCGLRDRTYGMPLVALCGNFAWEGIYTFVRPEAGIVWVSSAAWFALDCGIVYTALRFGPNEFSWLPRRVFYLGFAGVMALSWAGMEALIRQCEASGGQAAGPLYSSLILNVVISALFVGMVAGRRSTAGQSLAIAGCKLLGGVFVVVAVCLGVRAGQAPGGPLLVFLLVCMPLLDTVYLAALVAVRRMTAHRQGQKVTLPAPAAG